MFEWYNNYSYTSKKNKNLNKKIHTVLNETKTTWSPPKHKIVYFALSQLLVLWNSVLCYLYTYNYV